MTILKGTIQRITDSAGATGVTAAAVIASNAVVKGSGGARGVAASGVLIDSSNNITFPAGQVVATRVVTAAGAVTVAATDYVVVVNKTVGAATIVNLPAGSAGMFFIIKDGKGDANSNNMTLTPAAGTIDGAATYAMTVNYQSTTVVYNGTQWNIV